jgi:hypothetical protein
MTPPNSWAIETALIAVLQADAELRALAPDGVFYDLAPPNAQRFVTVSLIDPTDLDTFGGRGMEDNLYQVKAVGLSTDMTVTQSKAAAYRIDQLLDVQPLTVEGYGAGLTFRDPNRSRIRKTEPHAADASLSWLHGGAYYRAQISLLDPTTRT